MSLRVWLPLDGDLHNQGLSTVTVSSGTATYGAGKIGTKGLDLINSAQINLFCDKLADVTTFSICCWIKGSKDTSDSDWVSPIRFGVKKSNTTEKIIIRVEQVNNCPTASRNGSSLSYPIHYLLVDLRKVWYSTYIFAISIVF